MTASASLLSIALAGALPAATADAFAAPVAIPSAALVGASAASTWAAVTATRVERARYLMGTLCTASAIAVDTTAADSAVAAALDEIARLERALSSWREDSELSGFNRAAGAGLVACSPDLAAVLDSALLVAALTDGAFDPTVDPLVRAWDLRGEGRLPGPGELATARDLVGWRGLTLDHETRSASLARRGMGVDLGGIGKGFALDRAAATLTRRGVTRALLNLGGEVLVLGGGERIVVSHPARRLTAAVELAAADVAVSTSGQSERGFTVGGTRYGHILDPRTGRPAPTAATVTVVCRSATRADGLSTALLVMGRERAAAFARDHPDVGVLWLEPTLGELRAWRWNLAGVQAVPGVRVRWMERSDVPH